MNIRKVAVKLQWDMGHRRMLQLDDIKPAPDWSCTIRPDGTSKNAALDVDPDLDLMGMFTVDDTYIE